LACSLHEIASILGPERAEKDLIPILEAILQDHSENFKICKGFLIGFFQLMR